MSTVVTSSGLPAAQATAARVFMPILLSGRAILRRFRPRVTP
jgi:hypothetical protein